MSILSPDEIRSAAYASARADLAKAGRDIYELLNAPANPKPAWKRQRASVEIKPDHFYSPREVAAVLSVSYDTAIRTMERMKRTANLAQPHAKKRLLRVKGSDLRDYLSSKTSE